MLKRGIGNPISSIINNRELVWQLATREFVARYRGSKLGLVWVIFQPLLMLSVYSFVFGKVFPSRWGGVGGELHYVSMLFCGMIIHTFFAECVNRAPLVILSQPNYVKKVVFPLEILPLVPLCSALFNSGLGLMVLFGLILVEQHAVPATALFFLPIILAFSMFVLGLSWLFASLGVYIRDIGQVTGVLTLVLMFLSPVFYSVEALPERYRYLMEINPLTFVIEESRKALLLGESPNWTGLLAYTIFGALVALSGFFWFQKTRRGFADVL